MANIPGASGVLPGVYTDVVTQSRGVSVPGGIRVLSIVGLGSRSEVIVSSALGNGKDGFNSTYTSTNGSDGRHFKLSLFPLVNNRTTLYKNGVPLVGLEEQINANKFSNKYDYRIDPATGRIELQTAALVDLGGSYYSSGATNIGVGTIDGYNATGIKLLDANAPTETWSIKCVSVQRNAFNQPIQNTAKFIAFGSVSGNILDANGNPSVWIANGQEYNNGILSFAISETKDGSGNSISPFREGDYFTIKVKGGALIKNDTLTATYIASTDINDPVFFTEMDSLTKKHGAVSLDNTLSLGAQLAFDNGTPGVLAMQAAPPLPRRTSYNLLDSFDALSTNVDDFIIPLPYGVVPDVNSSIHFFATNPVTGVETQLLPNKLTYYTLDTAGYPTTNSFVFDDTPAPGGYSFYYTVVQRQAALNFATDGYLNRSLTSQVLGTFSTGTATFDLSYIGKKLKIFDATNLANNGTFDIVGVSNGKLIVKASASPPFSDYVNDTGVYFHLINPNTGTTIAGTTGTDGILTAIPSSATGTFSSVAINFGAVSNLTSMKIKITASATATNLGTFDIISYNPIGDVLTIAKSFVSEANLKFEVLDPADTSSYIVLNHNVMPDGHSLRVTLIDTKDASFYDAGWQTAFQTLEAFELDILVPLPNQTYSVIFQNALTHCKTMSNIRNKRERVLFTGAIKGLIPDNLTGAKLAAVEDIGVLEGIQGDEVTEVLAGTTEDLTNYSVPDAFGTTYRCAYFYPDEIVVNVGGENQLIDGFYLAAAAGGFFSGTALISMPITNKVLSGFTILRDKQLPQSTLESLATAGVSVLQPVAGGGRVIWGKTTTQSGFPEEEEISIVFIRDRIAKSMRAGFAGFIGLPEDLDTIPMLTARAVGLLRSFITQKLITDWRDLVVKRDEVDPRQWNIAVRVAPVYPINWIYIKVGIGTL